MCETQNINNEIIKYNKKIENLKEALKNLYIDKVSELISEDEFIELKKQIENDRNNYTNRVTELNRIIKENSKNSEKVAIIEKKIKQFLDFKKPNKQILMELIQKIEIMKNKQVKIYVKYNLD